MPIERLTAEDALMLWPDRVWPQDIGALVFLEGGRIVDSSGRVRIEVAQDAVKSRLHLVPRFRQLLYEPPQGMGGPLWIDAQTFDVRDHVQAIAVPAPGVEDQLLATVERLRQRRLDRSRPLWEMWFMTGLQDGRIGLFVRMHHCIADGMAGVATIARFLDASSDVEIPVPEAWTPSPVPAEQDLADDARCRRRSVRRARLARLAHPAKTVRQALAAWPAIRELVAERPLPSTSLNRVVGAERRLALVRADLGLVRETAHANDAKVNDVFLAALAGGLRALLTGRGESVDGQVLRIYVPISLHRGDLAEAHGNLIAQMVVPVPIGDQDSLSRLCQIALKTSERKARARPGLGKVPHGGVGGRVFLKLVDRQHVNVSSADIPGPEVPLYFAGARLLEVFPMVQLIGTNSLTVGAMSYAGRFNMMVVADRDGYPDLDVFVAGLQSELRALTFGLPKSAVA